ncbi:hypothetical protein XELAEV_18000458mg, partial [Xenopus laevis]
GGTGESSSVSIKEGDSQEIYCKVDSNPTANIIWTRGKSPVENIQKQNGQNVTLSLRNVTENDSDTYTCTAQNQRGNNSRSISVSVEYAPRQTIICVQKLEGCLPVGNVTVPDGSSLSLHCEAKSNPQATFSWSQNGSLKKISGNDVLNVQVTANIEYTCQAENKYGLSNSSIIIIATPLQKPQTNFLIVGLCILFLTLVVVIAVFVFRRMRKKKDLQEDRTTKEMPKSDSDGIYNDMDNMKIYDLHIDIEEAKLDKDYSDLHINNETEVQYSSLDFSNIKSKEDPQTEIIYSEVKRK